MIEFLEPDGELDEEQRELVSKLSEAELRKIDETLLSNASLRYKKVAMIVATSMMDLMKNNPDLPDIFYSQRIQKLVAEGRLVAEGNLDYMRYSEVRLS